MSLFEQQTTTDSASKIDTIEAAAMAPSRSNFM